jgi:hypothetical protein
METRGRSWTPTGANTSYGPVNWTVLDCPGPANPPETRKIGSSILPLTTFELGKRVDQTCHLTATLYCGKRTVMRHLHRLLAVF